VGNAPSGFFSEAFSGAFYDVSDVFDLGDHQGPSSQPVPRPASPDTVWGSAVFPRKPRVTEPLPYHVVAEHLMTYQAKVLGEEVGSFEPNKDFSEGVDVTITAIERLRRAINLKANSRKNKADFRKVIITDGGHNGAYKGNIFIFYFFG
jgi:hypothetical protein